MSNAQAVPALLILIAIATNGCWSSETPSNAAAPLAPEKTNYPFNVKEPAVYSARIVVTTASKTAEHFVARNGNRSRTDSNVGTPNHTSRIVGEREIVISHAAKTYYEVPRGSGDTADLGESTATIRGLFISPERAKFESVGSENGLTKYRVRLSQDDRGEAYVFVDDKAGMIMRQEFYAGDGGERSVVYVAEIRDLKLEASDELFAIPAGFRKITAP